MNCLNIRNDIIKMSESKNDLANIISRFISSAVFSPQTVYSTSEHPFSFSSSATQFPRRSYEYIPFDMYEIDSNIHIYAHIPGVEKKDISVDVFNNEITIDAESSPPHEQNPVQSEILYGKLHRKIKIPFCITRKETMKISYTNGILYILINRAVEEDNRFRATIE
jgi:HSP20 family protein